MSPCRAEAQNRHEDEEAVVTVVTRENDSDDDLSEEDDDDSDDEGAGMRGFPFRAVDGGAGEAPEPQSASTPYNPSKTHQASALQKAKQALKAKDKMHRKGIKGGHAFKRAKLTSKKKAVKFGRKKGANRDR